MRRPQFTLKTLLWLMALVAALFGGREWGIRYERQTRLDDLVLEQERIRDELEKIRAEAVASLNRWKRAKGPVNGQPLFKGNASKMASSEAMK
jgi:hypothetical protein